MELNVHLNGDEAMSFGAAFIASNSSASYKVRKVYLTQHPRNNIRIKITPLTMEGEEADLESSEIEYSKDVVLYSKSDYLGQRKTIHLDYDKNMRIVASNVFDDDSEEDLVSFEVTGIDKIMDKDEFKNGNTTTPKVSLSFELSRSNLFQLSSAKLTSNSTTYELVEKKKKKEEPKKKETQDEAFDEDEVKAEETSDAAVNDAPESADAEPESDADNKEEATESEAEAEPEAEEEAEPEYKEVIKPLDYPLDKISETRIGARTLDKTQKKAAEKRLKALAKRDEDK